MTWSDVNLIAGREISTRLHQKAFVVSTVITVLIVAAIAVLPGVLRNDDPSSYRVGVVAAGQPLADRVTALDDGDPDVTVTIVPVDDADASVGAGDVRAVLVGSNAVVVDESLPDGLGVLLDRAARDVAVLDAAADDGGAVSDALAAPSPLQVRALDPPNEEDDARAAIVIVGMFLLFTQIIGFGFWVASAVVEEKSSRVVEVLLSKVSSTALLAGKVIGLGVLGLGQLVLFAIVGVAGASLSSTVDLPVGWWWPVLQLFGWFLLGYTFWACAFAAAGALVSRQEELQNGASPVRLVLMLSYTLAIFAIAAPDNPLVVVGSMVPTAAPLVMPLRMGTSDVVWWQPVVAALLTAVAAGLLVVAAGRVYSGGALRTRGRMSLREAWQAAD